MSVSFVAFRACTYLERTREPPRALRGLRWPEGRDRFSGAFLELAPSSGSSSDAFHINMQYLVTVMFFQLCPFPRPGIPSFAR